MPSGRSRPSGQSRGSHVPSAELQPASTTKRDGWLLTTVEAVGGVTEQRPWSKKFWERIYVAARKAGHDDASWRTSMMGYRRLRKKLTAAPPLASKGTPAPSEGSWLGTVQPTRSVSRDSHHATAGVTRVQQLSGSACEPGNSMFNAGGVPKGNRTYVDAQTPRKSAGCGLSSPRPVDSEP